MNIRLLWKCIEKVKALFIRRYIREENIIKIRVYVIKRIRIRTDRIKSYRE